MSLQNMELFDQLTMPQARTSDGGWVENELKDHLNAAVRLNAAVASQVYYESDQEVWDMEDGDFPPLKPAFPQMWIEWKIPTSWRSEGETVSNNLAGWTVGVHVTECPPGPKAPERAASGLLIKPAILRPWNHPDLLSTTVVVLLDSDGIGFGRPFIVGVNPIGDVHILVQPALLAIGLMNCRNVTLGTDSFRPRRASGKNRKRVPRLDYHTIVLPGHVTQPTKKQSGNSTSQVLPQHRVRGHFKTYTTERPLLGHHVGTYWWGWQVRGSKANGITVTDYSLAGSAL